VSEFVWFIGVMLAFAPAVLALVNAVADDWSGMPRYAKRLLALVFGVGASFVAQYVVQTYMGMSVAWQVALIGGAACALSAMGVYDVGDLIGGGSVIKRE